MAELKISDYIDVDSIDGTELILVSKGGSYRKTTIEEIRNLASDIANTELAELLNKAASAQDVKNILNTINTNLKNHSDSITSINASLSEIVQEQTTQNTNIANKVDKVLGKGLSTNDYDNTEKTQVAINKSDITIIKSQVASLSSGSPKGVYATVSALQAAYPTGTSGIYIVINPIGDGKDYWYYYNNTAWVSGGVYQSTGIADESIKGEHINNAITNVFENYSEGKLYRASGVTSIVADSDNITTDYIAINPGDIIYSNAKITAYETEDINKAITRYGNFAVASYTNTLQTTATDTATKFIRLSLQKSSVASVDNIVVTINKNTSKPIQIGKSYIPWIDIQEDNLGFNISDVVDLTDKITYTDFKNRLSNLLEGVPLSTGRLVRSNGVTSIDSTQTTYRTTDYIPINDGDILYCSTANLIFETENSSKSITAYKETGSSISEIDVGSNGSSYVRISFPINVITADNYLIFKNIKLEEVANLSDGETIVPWLKITKENLLFNVTDAVDLSNDYDFSNTKLVIPDNLYLVKDYDYAIHPDAFLSIDRSNNLDLKFEMIMPTYSELTRDSLLIKSPVAQKFKTKLVAIQNNDTNKEIARDITLNFKDVNAIVNKNVNVLIIGDSIQNAGMPGFVYFWLKQFGLNPTMYGTCANDNISEFGYGVDPAITPKNGEGRGGWRTTDFLNITKYLDGTHFDVMYNYKPMWNTSGVFDFPYYISQNFSGVTIDIVIIALGTNDIGGGHYSGLKSQLYLPTTHELLEDSSSPYYMPTMFNTMISSIKTHNSNAKILLAPPQNAGIDDNFNSISKRWANLQIEYFRNVSNVYVLGQYLAHSHYSGEWQQGITHTAKFVDNATYNMQTTGNVHRNYAAQQNTGLWFASAIANMMN